MGKKSKINMRICVEFKRGDDKSIKGIPECINEWFRPRYTTKRYLTSIYNYIERVDDYSIVYINDQVLIEVNISGEIVLYDAEESLWDRHRNNMSDSLACDDDGIIYRYTIVSAEFIDIT